MRTCEAGIEAVPSIYMVLDPARPPMRQRATAVLLAGLAFLAAVSPLSSAQAEARTLVFAVAEVEGLAAPRTTFDGVDAVGAAASAGDAYNRFQRAFDLRRGSAAPVELGLEVDILGRMLTAWATPRVADPAGPDETQLGISFLLVVDAVHGALPVQRFRVLDDSTDAPPMLTARDGGLAHGVEFAVPSDVDLARVGVVAYVTAQNASGRHQEGEVLQSALWLASFGDAPVEQRGKAVLVIHETADACAACVHSDEALALLVSQNGYPVSATERGESYLVPPRPVAYVGALAGLALGVALARRRA